MEITDTFGQWFDASMQAGTLPGLCSRFDNRALIDRRHVPGVLANMGHEALSVGDLDRWAEQGWFAWRAVIGGDGEADKPAEGIAIGLPMYVVERLPLFVQLSGDGWTDEELAAYAEYEDEFVASILLDDWCPAPSSEDDGVSATLVHLASERRQLEDEVGARRPREEWPDGWHWQSRNSEMMALDDAVLAARLRNASALADRLETSGWSTIADDSRYRILRHVFIRAQWEEMVNVAMLEVERRPLRAGVSWFLPLCSLPYGPERLFGALDEDGGAKEWAQTFKPDWAAIVARPWCTDDGEELPMRLPGLVLHNGQPTLTGQANPAGYAELYRRWDLGSYFKLHAESAGIRRCRHCHATIDGPPSKRYCSSECSHAFRQHTLRSKRKSPANEGPFGSERGTLGDDFVGRSLPGDGEESA